MSSSVELRDGSYVPYDCYLATCHAIDSLKVGDKTAVYALLQKCLEKKEPEFFEESRPTLQKYYLIDGNDNVDPSVKKVVLNALQGSKFKDMEVRNPAKACIPLTEKAVKRAMNSEKLKNAAKVQHQTRPPKSMNAGIPQNEAWADDLFAKQY